MAQYQQFIFDSYQFDPQTGVLDVHYALDEHLHFTETFRFNFPFTQYDPQVLDRALQTLFFIAGVSYYKLYVPPEIVINAGQMDASMAHFFSKTYQRGLGEFWYVNKLDPRTPVSFPSTSDELPVVKHHGDGQLVAVGGGKDSLVAIEMLRSQGAELTTWSLSHQTQLLPLVQAIGTPHAWVERTWDPQLISLREQGSLSGHIPISAIFGATGVIVAILTGNRDVVMSNEQSSNEATLRYQGVEINHQYSKSQEFEQDFQDYLAKTFGDSIRYYSFLRPLSEVRIAELFSKLGFDKYKDTFSSCNRAFVHTSERMSWCGECPKCAFIFLALTPFVERHELEQLWGGKNLLQSHELDTMYRNLLGIEGDKPLDCVGEVKESRAAMRLAQEQYPELVDRYKFEITPATYTYAALGSEEMPHDIRKKFDHALRKI